VPTAPRARSGRPVGRSPERPAASVSGFRRLGRRLYWRPRRKRGSPQRRSHPRLDIGGLNALAESFVDSFKTELITDRVWKTRSQLELAVVEYIGWFSHTRLHEALGDIPPAEMEALYAPRTETNISLQMRRGSQLTRSP
jgi:transposase InsO family protein